MTSQHDQTRTGIMRRDLMYARYYLWFIVASALDIIMTAVVISIGGYEANPLADVVIGRFGMHGAMAYKFALALVVILCCEAIGRHNERRGRWVAAFAVSMPAFAALLGYSLILRAAGAE